MSQPTRSRVSLPPNPAVILAPSGLLQRKCSCSKSATLTGQCGECDRKKLVSERHSSDAENTSEAPIVHEALRSPIPNIQPKLKVSQPNDQYEQEADRIADQIMRAPDLSLHQIATTNNEATQPQPMNNPIISTAKSKVSGALAPLLYNSTSREAAKVIKSGGQPLSKEMLSYFEPRFGQSLSNVRVHTNQSANTAASRLNARAFTIGQDIAFAQGAYNPKQHEGQKLIAHELVHTLQQRNARSIDTIYRMSLEEIISEIRRVRYEEISSQDLKNLDVDDLRVVFDETVTQIKAYQGMRRSRIALDFLTYKLSPELRRRTGIQARFEPEIGEALKGVYTTENLKPGDERIGCMVALYEGLKIMMPEDIVEEARAETTREGTALREKREREAHKKGKKLTKDERVRGTITLSRFMGKLQRQGRAGSATALKYQPRIKKWTPDPEQHILKLSETAEPGWFFFGVSMHSYHTGILAVDRTGATPKIYWLDQFGNRNLPKEKEGFHRELTGKVDEVFKEFRPSFGFAETKIWQILIPPECAENKCIVDDTKP